MRSQIEENVMKQLEDFHVQQRLEKEELMTQLSNLIDTKMNAGTSPATAWSQTQVQQNCVDFRTIMKETIVEQVKERADLENRETNLIIHHVEESEKADSKERADEDAAFFGELCKTLQIQPHVPKKTIRLGKKQVGKDITKPPPRPLKVVLETNAAREQLMTNLTNLKNADPKFKAISVARDYPKEVREEMKMKLQEAKARDGDEAKNFIYRMRGQPHQFSVHKLRRRPRVDASTLAPVPQAAPPENQATGPPPGTG